MKKVFVVPVLDGKKLVGWTIKFAKEDLPGSYFKTQKEAIAVAIQTAKEMRAELRVQSRKGKWRIANSYGNDPNPPKG